MKFSVAPARALLLLSAFVASTSTLTSIIGCSGSSTPAGPQIVVSVSGPAATRLNGTAQFTAVVTGTTNTAVTWQVGGVTGGTTATGIISATGLYTAPAVLPNTALASITARSETNPPSGP